MKTKVPHSIEVCLLYKTFRGNAIVGNANFIEYSIGPIVKSNSKRLEIWERKKLRKGVPIQKFEISCPLQTDN